MRRPLRAPAALVAAALVCGLAAGCSRPSPRPSILLFVMDTTRFDAMSSNGNPRPASPEFDAIAARGLRFTRAYSVAPWTLPSHVSLFTGELPSRHGVGWRHTQAPDELIFLAERLKAAGYETAGVSENVWITPHFRTTQGLDHFEWIKADGPTTTEAVRTWLGKRDRTRPFYLFVNVIDAHSPYGDDAACPFLPEGVTPDAAKQTTQDPKERMCATGDAEREKTLRALYDCDVHLADAKLGAVRRLLADAGPLVTIATADHGEHFGEHGLVSHQFSVREELLHVPLAVEGLAGAKPAVVDTPVQLTDVTASILKWAGLAVPAEVDGIALPEQGGAHAAERTLVAEYADYESLSADSEVGKKMLERAAGWRKSCREEDRVFGNMRSATRWPLKLIAYDRYPDQLYDLSLDPAEAHDLSAARTSDRDALRSSLGPLESPSPR